VRPTHHSQTPGKFPQNGETGGIENGAWDAPYAGFGLSQGYLIMFETRSGKTWEERIYREVVEVNGKTVILMGM